MENNVTAKPGGLLGGKMLKDCKCHSQTISTHWKAEEDHAKIKKIKIKKFPGQGSSFAKGKAPCVAISIRFTSVTSAPQSILQAAEAKVILEKQHWFPYRTAMSFSLGKSERRKTTALSYKANLSLPLVMFEFLETQ